MLIGGVPVKTYGYDAGGRATSIVGPGINQTNVYNGLDTRVGSTTNSATQTFLRDGACVTDPVLSDGSAIYTPGISERRAGDTAFLHSGLKNADAQTSTSETVAATRQYGAFGNVISDTGSWTGPFGYAGAFGYQEDTTGLKLLGHRFYDPSTGRFLTRDPIKDGRNWYAYGGGLANPVSGIDPTELFVFALPLAFKIGVKIGYYALLAHGVYKGGKTIYWAGVRIKNARTSSQLIA